jgi:chemotaxis protein methyltransferase CheR
MTLGAQKSPPDGLERFATGEFSFSDANFREIARIAKAEAGIDLPDSKATLVYSRLAKRLRALKISTFSDYCTTVRENDEERNSMIAALTTNVTRFFREPHHFEHLRREIIGPLADAARSGKRIRLWSAACSSGQEAYSMALAILSVLPDAAALDVRILATDLNPHVVARGKSGIYQSEELQDIPSGIRARWFEPVPGSARGGDMQVVEEVRSLVAFRELNLIGSWPFSGPFDVIFCRNVVIYFDRDTQSAIWSRMARLLTSEGALYIGHSERISGPAGALLSADGITTYRRNGGAAS